jgi:hypothetical protein
VYHLYQITDSTGIIWVGQTKRVGQRLRRHRKKHGDITMTIIGSFSNKIDVLSAELDLIAKRLNEGCKLKNKFGTVGHPTKWRGGEFSKRKVKVKSPYGSDIHSGKFLSPRYWSKLNGE